MEKRKIILDTCVIISLVANLKKTSSIYFKNMNKYQKLIYLANKGQVEFYVTPQIFKELTNPHFYNPNKKNSALNYILTNYLNLISFDETNIQLVNNLAKEFGTKKLDSDKTVFSLAKREGDRNFADCRIYAESVAANLSIITDNLKDFKNYKLATQILKPLKIQNFSRVYGVDEFVNELTYENSHKPIRYGSEQIL